MSRCLLYSGPDTKKPRHDNPSHRKRPFFMPSELVEQRKEEVENRMDSPPEKPPKLRFGQGSLAEQEDWKLDNPDNCKQQ